MIGRSYRVLEQAPPRLVFVLGSIAVLALGIIDIVTGYEVSFSIFYLLPIVMVSASGRRSLGAIISLLSALAWLYADIMSGHNYSHDAIPVWNSVMRLGLFLLVAYFITENRRLLQKEQELARTDALTGAANSRAMRTEIDQELRRSDRTGKPVSLVYLDVDNFKHVNDTQGHGAGDRLLVAIADTLRKHIRDIDTLGRLGGDEFAILMPETGEEAAQVVVQRAKDRLLDAVRSAGWPVTFSFGLLTCYERSCAVDDLIKDADALMYRSKTGGKNRITSETRTVRAA